MFSPEELELLDSYPDVGDDEETEDAGLQAPERRNTAEKADLENLPEVETKMQDQEENGCQSNCCECMWDHEGVDRGWHQIVWIQIHIINGYGMVNS